MITKQKIISVLKELGVQYYTSGKNVTSGSVGIHCPYCGARDPSNHCGIMEGNGVFSCWICHTKGPFVRLIQKLSGLSQEQCEAMVHGTESFKKDSEDQIRDILNEDQEETRKKKNEFTGLPQYFTPITPGIEFPLLFKYLTRRRISIDTIIKHGCGICRVGKYMNRMIIPIVFGGKIVSFQAADLTGTAELKYDTAPGDINEYLYDYDDLEDGGRIILTEGILDKWRVGNDAVCSFGTHLTNTQKSIILAKKPKELVMLWDNDAWADGMDEMGYFEPFIETVRMVVLPHGHDPDSYGRDFGVEELHRYINDN